MTPAAQSRRSRAGSRGEAVADALVSVTIPGLKLVSEANAHTHWRLRATRAKRQRNLTVAILRAQGGTPPAPPLVVTITRVAPRALDGDNAVGSAKHVRDGVADWLGLDDRDPRVEWRVAQAKDPKPKTYAVVIEVRKA